MGTDEDGTLVPPLVGTLDGWVHVFRQTPTSATSPSSAMAKPPSHPSLSSDDDGQDDNGGIPGITETYKAQFIAHDRQFEGATFRLTLRDLFGNADLGLIWIPWCGSTWAVLAPTP